VPAAVQAQLQLRLLLRRRAYHHGRMILLLATVPAAQTLTNRRKPVPAWPTAAAALGAAAAKGALPRCVAYNGLWVWCGALLDELPHASKACLLWHWHKLQARGCSACRSQREKGGRSRAQEVSTCRAVCHNAGSLIAVRLHEGWVAPIIRR
jgi:hypothetical protein